MNGWEKDTVIVKSNKIGYIIAILLLLKSFREVSSSVNKWENNENDKFTYIYVYGSKYLIDKRNHS